MEFISSTAASDRLLHSPSRHLNFCGKCTTGYTGEEIIVICCDAEAGARRHRAYFSFLISNEDQRHFIIGPTCEMASRIITHRLYDPSKCFPSSVHVCLTAAVPLQPLPHVIIFPSGEIACACILAPFQFPWLSDKSYLAVLHVHCAVGNQTQCKLPCNLLQEDNAQNSTPTALKLRVLLWVGLS